MTDIHIQPCLNAQPDGSVRRDGWLRVGDVGAEIRCDMVLRPRDIAELREQALQLIPGPRQVKPSLNGDRRGERVDATSRLHSLVWNETDNELQFSIDDVSVSVRGITPNDVLDRLDEFSADVDDDGGRR